MQRINDNSPEVIQAKKKANLVYSRLLDFVRTGNITSINAVLNAPEYSKMTKFIVGDDYDFAFTVVQFLLPQITRAAIQGGLGEMDGASLYLEYLEHAKEAKTCDELVNLVQRLFMDCAERVAALHIGERYSPLTALCRAYIAEHVFDYLTAHDVADALHISRSHLSHIYKLDTGETIGERIHTEKIEAAKGLLHNTQLSISEIAQMLGFSSQSRFTEVFHKDVGVTPGQYR